MRKTNHYLGFCVKATMDCIAMAGVVLFAALITLLLGS